MKKFFYKLIATLLINSQDRPAFELSYICDQNILKIFSLTKSKNCKQRSDIFVIIFNTLYFLLASPVCMFVCMLVCLWVTCDDIHIHTERKTELYDICCFDLVMIVLFFITIS